MNPLTNWTISFDEGRGRPAFVGDPRLAHLVGAINCLTAVELPNAIRELAGEYPLFLCEPRAGEPRSVLDADYEIYFHPRIHPIGNGQFLGDGKRHDDYYVAIYHLPAVPIYLAKSFFFRVVREVCAVWAAALSRGGPEDVQLAEEIREAARSLDRPAPPADIAWTIECTVSQTGYGSGHVVRVGGHPDAIVNDVLGGLLGGLLFGPSPASLAELVSRFTQGRSTHHEYYGLAFPEDLADMNQFVEPGVVDVYWFEDHVMLTVPMIQNFFSAALSATSSFVRLPS